jgi:predicted RNA-binding Zn-ribbon protein involved in translation (DUF1610 family)
VKEEDEVYACPRCGVRVARPPETAPWGHWRCSPCGQVIFSPGWVVAHCLLCGRYQLDRVRTDARRADRNAYYANDRNAAANDG